MQTCLYDLRTKQALASEQLMQMRYFRDCDAVPAHGWPPGINVRAREARVGLRDSFCKMTFGLRFTGVELGRDPCPQSAAVAGRRLCWPGCCARSAEVPLRVAYLLRQ